MGGMIRDSPLELSLENLHVQVVLVNFLLASTLRLGLVAFLVHEHADLVRSSHALDGFGLEVLVSVAWRTRGRLVEVPSTVDFAVDSRVRVDGAGLVVLRKHHEPLVLLFAVLGEKSAGLFLGDAGVLHDAKVLATISLNNDHVAFSDDEAGVVKEVKDADARALERYNVEHLARAAAGKGHADRTVGVHGTFVRFKGDVRHLVAFRERERLAGVVGGGIAGVVIVVAVDAVHVGVVVVDVVVCV
jgi:hypothetical protein